MADDAVKLPHGIESPLRSAFAITPNDEADLPDVARGIYVGTGGDLAVVMAGGATVTFVGLAPGVVHPFIVRRVLATGTTADDIIGGL